jgi:hypothetical protein
MNFRIQTKYDEMCLKVVVKVKTPTIVTIRIFDEQKPKIVFTDRYKTIHNTETFYIRLPLTSDSVILSVYDNKKGNLSKEQENNISVVSIDKTPLEKRMDVVDIKNKNVAYFVDFAQRFCFNSSYLQPNKSYQSDNGQYVIEYLPTIINTAGKELTTPARISKVSGRIQVSKKQFDKYTIPMRFAILCHEFSHFYVNDDMENESEADINGLLIYLGLGYPRIEGYQAFLEVFKDAPNESNKKRFDRIDAFIRNFEKNKMVLR